MVAVIPRLYVTKRVIVPKTQVWEMFILTSEEFSGASTGERSEIWPS